MTGVPDFCVCDTLACGRTSAGHHPSNASSRKLTTRRSYSSGSAVMPRTWPPSVFHSCFGSFAGR